ncbi:dienelactone hydrolase family protein [Phenylobacterium sp. LjRoot219]|uniref:dienelactone hydrolase family protein n=1 Tax=Phenylobacterium sp. LjRoot219 TaxID=3342283 RepID=UPI003ED1622D
MGELRALDYEHEGVLLKGELALPAGPGPHPAVLVMHDAHGLGDHVRRRALALADLGYAALATDMYGGGKLFTGQTEVGPFFLDLQENPQRLRGRVLAAFEALRARPEVDQARMGAIGFCFGGQCVLELARSGAAARGVVSFHGLLHTSLPARAGEVKAKVLVLTGGRDPYAPADAVAGLQRELTEAGVDWQLTVYGEGWHAFTDPNPEKASVPGVRYDPLIDKLSWAQATAFLDATLRD